MEAGVKPNLAGRSRIIWLRNDSAPPLWKFRAAIASKRVILGEINEILNDKLGDVVAVRDLTGLLGGAVAEENGT